MTESEEVVATDTHEDSSEGKDSRDVGREPGRFTVSGVLIVTTVVVVTAWACYVWISGEKGFDVRRFAFLGPEQKQLYAAHGEVYFNDELVTSGHVEAVPLQKRGGPDRIIGPINSEGHFDLYSDYGGTLQSGAPAGEYQLLLVVLQPATGMGPPTKLLPEKYYETSTTPLKMTVTPDAEKNHLVIRESGEVLLETLTDDPPPDQTSE